MPDIPYILQLNVVLGANALGELQHIVPTNEKLEVMDLVFTSTGIFNIEEIDVTGGYSMTNATPNNPIPSTALQNGANNNNNVGKLAEKLILNGGSRLSISVKDTSGAGNTVRLTANCRRIAQST